MIKQHGYSSVASISLALMAAIGLLLVILYIAHQYAPDNAGQVRLASARSGDSMSSEADDPTVGNLTVEENLDKARSLAMELVQNHPGNAVYLQSLAEITAKQGDYQDAFDYYERAADINPDEATLRCMARLHQRLGRHQEALAILEEAYSLAPESIETLEALAISCLHCDQVPRANRLADTLFTIVPDAPGGHVIKMFSALAEGRTGEASDHYLQFKQLGKHRSDYDELIGMYDSTLR